MSTDERFSINADKSETQLKISDACKLKPLFLIESVDPDTLQTLE